MGAAAVVTSLTGSAFALRNGQSHPLSAGSELHASDEVRTEADGKLEMRFADDALVELGPSSSVALREFVFDPRGETSPSFILDMMGGVVRSVSGKVVEQNPESFKLTSPLGAVGIRGTTTMHKITPEAEVHMVTDMSRGHTVTLSTPDGRHVVIGNSMQGVNLAAGSSAPLTIMQISPDMIETMIQQGMINGKAVGAASSTTFFIAMDAEAVSAEAAEAAGGGNGGGAGISLAVADVATGAAETVDLSAAAAQEVAEAVQAISAAMAAGVLETAAARAAEAARGLPAENHNDGGGHEHGHEHAGGEHPDMPDWDVKDYDYNRVSGSPQADSITVDPWGAVTIAGPAPASPEIDLSRPFLIMGGAGADDITLQADLKGGIIIGDLAGMHGIANSPVQCDGDAIRVTGAMESGIIFGDAREIAYGTGGSDNISVTGAMSGGFIFGDAHTFAHGTAGNDKISVSAMSGGFIFGDAHIITGSVAGNDAIEITGTMSGGVIYGDACGADQGGTAGCNTIKVADMSGGIIYGGSAVDNTTTSGLLAGSTDAPASSGNAIIIDKMSAGEIHAGKYGDKITIGSLSAAGDGESVIKIYAGAGDDIISLQSIAGKAVIELHDFDAAHDTLCINGANQDISSTPHNGVITIADESGGFTLTINLINEVSSQLNNNIAA